LQHAVERAVIMSDSTILMPHDFFLSTPAEDKSDNLDLET